MSAPEPSLSDIASMLRDIGDRVGNIDDKVDSVKADLTKSMNDQAASLEASFKRNIDDAVGPLEKKQEDYETKSDDRFKKLEQSVANLTELVKGKSEREPLPPQNITALPDPRVQQHLPAPVHTSHPLPGVSPLPPPSPSPPVHDEPVHKLICSARHVVGIGPVYQSHLDHYQDASTSEKIRCAAIDALRLELNIKDDEIKDSDILETFLPKSSPKFPRVYIRFIRQEQADLCLRAAKSLTDPNVKVFRYFPRQLQARVRALEDVAYQLRKYSVPSYKTDVIYSETDVLLMVCPRGQSRYHPYPVSNLPPIDMTPLRSPPPGRPSQKRDRSASSSPKQNKAVRQKSPELSREESADTATGQTDSAPDPIPSLNQTTDQGGFSSMEVMSPLTGRVSFNFKEPVNLRRQSLNF